MTKHTTARIEALIGHDRLSGTAWDLASRAIDAVLEDGTEHHTGWTASDAIECAAPYVGELSGEDEAEAEAEALAAVEAALSTLTKMAASPVVHALINLDCNVLYAVGTGSETVRAELDQAAGAGITLEWARHFAYPTDYAQPIRVSRGAGRYAEYRIPDVICDEGSADTIAALGECQGYWTATELEKKAA